MIFLWQKCYFDEKGRLKTFEWIWKPYWWWTGSCSSKEYFAFRIFNLGITLPWINKNGRK